MKIMRMHHTTLANMRLGMYLQNLNNHTASATISTNGIMRLSPMNGMPERMMLRPNMTLMSASFLPV